MGLNHFVGHGKRPLPCHLSCLSLTATVFKNKVIPPPPQETARSPRGALLAGVLMRNLVPGRAVGWFSCVSLVASDLLQKNASDDVTHIEKSVLTGSPPAGSHF